MSRMVSSLGTSNSVAGVFTPLRETAPTGKALKAALRSPVAQPIRIFIADDHALVRDGLSALLGMEADFTVLGQAHDGVRTLALVQELHPDVLLLDVSMPEMDGFDVLRELQNRNLPVRTILLTAFLDRAGMLAALQAGARGIVFKDSIATDLLLRSIRRVHAGEVWIGRETVADLLTVLPSLQPARVEPRRDYGLTPRELEVLRLIVHGETNKGIAKILSVGPDTVKHHLTSIFDKTGASNRLELALFALHHRLVLPEP